MNREIKFRAWNKSWKMMRPVDKIIFENGIAKEVRVTIPTEAFDKVDEWEDYYIGEDIELMRSLNVSWDNNTLYEGDIITYEDAPGCDDGTGAIVWDNDEFTYYVVNEHTGVCETLYNVIYNIVAIEGNIYENPELLEDL
jgi:hypothetical protein